MQCGPASIAAIRLGLSVPFDTDFLIGEVNADVRKYVRFADGTHKLTSTDTTDVGRMTLTKQLGTWDDEDIIFKYKSQEGSALERASLLRAEAEEKARSHPRGKLHLRINNDETVHVGQPIRVTLRLEQQDGEEYPPEGIKVSLIAFATQYTGQGQHVLGRLNQIMSPADASSTGIELTLDSSDSDFDRMHKGTGFPLTVVGTAMWKDLKPFQNVGAIDPNAKVTLIEEVSTELVPPELKLVSIKPDGASVGEELTVTIAVANPFSSKPLTGVSLRAEGRRCVPDSNPK